MMYNLQTYQSKKWQSLQLLLSARQLCPIWVNDSNNDITMFQFKTFVCMCSTVENTFSSYSYFLKNIDGLKRLSKDLNAEEGVTLIDNWKLIHLRLGCSIPTLFYYFESSMLNVFNQHSLFDNKNMWILLHEMVSLIDYMNRLIFKKTTWRNIQFHGLQHPMNQTSM